MERLEPVLKQKFWILLGLGIVMTFIGWWMATGAMASQTAERMTKIKLAEENVPKGEVPNETWAKRLAGLNSVQASSNDVTKLGLWKRQLTKMLVPEGLDQSVVYQGKFTSEDRETFRDLYPEEVRKVWKMLNPMDMDGSGVVNFPYISMLKVMNQKPWIVSAPKSEVIWDILEDLWLLEGLFQSIAEVNGGPTATRLEAVVHQIDKLELRGGGDMLPSGGASGGSSAEGMMGGMMGSGMMGGPTSMGGKGAGGAAGGITAVSAEFDVREEFGDDGSGASGGGGGNRQAAMMSSMMGDGGGGTPAADAVVKRYVSDEASRPFKTRGFYLSVKMDHRRIPQLIAELTANDKSVWPVEIKRVQMTRLHEDEMSGGGGGSGAGAYSGMQAMQRSQGASSSEEGMTSAMSSSMGSAGGGAAGGDDFSAFTNSGARGGASATKSAQAMAAQAVLDNTLRDPYMAQVTLCGVFTMYRKVDEAPESKPATSAPQNLQESAEAEVNGSLSGDENSSATGVEATGAESKAGAGSTPTDEQPATAAGLETDEPADPADNPDEMSDKPAAKIEDEKTGENPKNDNNLK